MDEIESQVAKIQIGNFKRTNSFVHVLAERSSGSDAELYVIAEMPLLNPAALDSAENICLSIAASLKRSYKRPLTSASFETAVAEINDELGKLAEIGQTSWVDKLNSIIAVKTGNVFHITTTGKIYAYLMRGGEFTDISCSSGKPHVLKTFENLASGKIRLGDMIILSTAQLFNNLAIDRLKEILESQNFLTASQTIIEILKENAGPDTAFGTIFNLQIPKGQAEEEDIDLEDYVANKPTQGRPLIDKVKQLASVFALLERLKRKPQVGLPKIAFSSKLKSLGGSTKAFFSKGRGFWTALGKGAAAGKQVLSISQFKNFSPSKKFFFISVIILLIALTANIFISAAYKKSSVRDTQLQSKLDNVKSLLAKAESSMLYNNETDARSYLFEAIKELPQPNEVSDKMLPEYEKTNVSIKELQTKVEKVREIQAQSLGVLANSENLIRLPKYLAIQSGSALVSFNKESGIIQDGAITSPVKIAGSEFARENLAVIFDGQSLYVWNFSNGTVGPAFSLSVPQNDALAGLAYYPTNSRIYVLDSKEGKILNYAVGTQTLSKPVLWAQNMDLTGAVDMAIDGAVYVLNKSGVSKWQSGKLAEFNQPFLLDPFSGSGKIYTEKDFKYLYVLDTGKNRILIMDKAGNLIASLTSSQFKDLKDFAVDEKASVIYVFTGSGELLKVNF